MEESPKDVDSLLECLHIIAAHHGRATSAEALVAGLPLPDGRLTPSLFPRAAERIGLGSALARRPLEKITPDLLPAVLLLRDEEACILLESTPGESSVRIAYPELPEVPSQVDLDELSARYTGVCLLAGPRYQFDARAGSVREQPQGQWFWGALRANLPVYRDVLLAAAMVNLFALAMPLFTMNVYDRVVPNNAVETLWVLALGIGIVLVADAALRTLRSYFLDLASRRVDVDLSSRIMERVLGLRLEARPLSAGSFAAQLRSFETVRDFITSATLTAVIDLPFTFIFAAALIWIGWPLVIPLGVGIATVVGCALATQHRMRALSETTYRAGAARNAILIESLVGLDTLKALRAEGQMQRRWEESASFLARTSIKLRLLATSNTNLTMWVQQSVSVAVVVIGVYRIGEGQLTMGGLIASSMLAGRALAPLAQVSALLTQYHGALTALTSLNAIMDQPVERPPGATFVSRRQFRGAIEFRNVSFAYPNQEVEVLRNISFRLEPGEHVGLLGAVGSGKTTLLRLITGLYQPTQGAILIDGVDLRQLDPAELRRQIGTVPQDVTLFYGTLRENLVLGNPHASDDAVLRASQIGGLDELANAHPRGFDLMVGERGESLSGGQRKCVALARGVIGDPPVLVMDEPTGSMDHSTESRVKRELAHFLGGKTLLVSTHRTTLLDLVDRVMVMDRGQFVADGPKATVVEALRQRRVSRAT